jgi:hypothetical protein
MGLLSRKAPPHPPEETPAPTEHVSKPSVIVQYETPLEAMTMPAKVTLPSGRIVSAICAGDASRGPRAFAQPSYERAVAFGELHGARLISYDGVTEIFDACGAFGKPPIEGAVLLTPETLPDSELLLAHIRKFGPRPPPKSPAEEQWLRRLYAPMATREWADRADERYWKQLDAAKYREGCLVANDRKWHQHGAPPFRCYIRGWLRNGRWIQAGVPTAQVGKVPGPHDKYQHDYGTGARYEFP